MDVFIFLWKILSCDTYFCKNFWFANVSIFLVKKHFTNCKTEISVPGGRKFSGGQVTENKCFCGKIRMEELSVSVFKYSFLDRKQNSLVQISKSCAWRSKEIFEWPGHEIKKLVWKILTCLCEASFSHKNDPSRKQGNLKLFLLHYVSCMEKRSV